MKPIAIFLAILAFTVSPLLAEGVESSSNLVLQVSSAPEAKLGFTQSFIFPFFRFSNPLTEGNSLALNLTAELTPISVNGIAELNFTPIAFLVLSGGGRAGSGWNIPLGSGIGINRPEDENAALPRKAVIDGSAFDGLLWAGWGALTFQFDLAALIPGDWNHVLFQTRQEMRYAAYTRAGPDDAWFFEGDVGENQNGWNYRPTYVLGYSMPASPVLNMIAVMAELEKRLYDSPDGDFWGASLGKWLFSVLANFSINPSLSTTLAIQMRSWRNHGTGDFPNKDYYYRDLELMDEGGQRRILFYRAALLVNLKI